MNKYLVEGSLFVPLLATHTKNLAGTASLLTQWWFGQGMDFYFEDFPNNASFVTVNQQIGLNNYCDREELKRFGGFIQLQYYFTNQWYAQAVWAMNKAYGVNRATWLSVSGGDPVFSNQHYYASLWYRPIQAVKFGLEYTYVRSAYYQNLNNNLVNAQKVDNLGENHRVMFAGYYYF
jgi:hypothetical protein